MNFSLKLKCLSIIISVYKPSLYSTSAKKVPLKHHHYAVVMEKT
jgi:hypothetical protein